MLKVLLAQKPNPARTTSVLHSLTPSWPLLMLAVRLGHGLSVFTSSSQSGNPSTAELADRRDKLGLLMSCTFSLALGLDLVLLNLL